jgi:hypothetical protein
MQISIGMRRKLFDALAAAQPAAAGATESSGLPAPPPPPPPPPLAAGGGGSAFGFIGGGTAGGGLLGTPPPDDAALTAALAAAGSSASAAYAQRPQVASGYAYAGPAIPTITLSGGVGPSGAVPLAEAAEKAKKVKAKAKGDLAQPFVSNLHHGAGM